MSLFQGADFPVDDDDELRFLPKEEKKDRRFPANSFRTVAVTPRSLDLVDVVIARSADFDRALSESANAAEEDCLAGSEAALAAYGDLVQAKGKLVEYMAALMDKIGDPNLNRRRSSQVRFE